jgi:acyl-CoA oxidase
MWLQKANNLNIIGCYAQTELGHGSNVAALETTATLDMASDEFVINTPNIKATKFWPGQLGLFATHAVVFARLIIKAKDYGI